MRGHFRSGMALVLACFVSTVALGCATGPTTAVTTPVAQASSSPTTWVEYVSVGGSLSRGRSSVNVNVSGGGLRFVVTVGPAPGGGADHAKFRYWLWPVTDSPIPPDRVPLRVAAKSHETEQDSTTYDLRTTKPLAPGTYVLLYNGEGWYQMTVYVQTV